jgi:hypothetical protein
MGTVRVASSTGECTAAGERNEGRDDYVTEPAGDAGKAYCVARSSDDGGYASGLNPSRATLGDVLLAPRGLMSNFPFPPPPPPRFRLNSRDWLIIAIIITMGIMLGLFLVGAG